MTYNVYMAYRKFDLTDEAARALMAAYHATDDGAYRTRLQAVRLYGLGYSTAQIIEITGCARSSLMEWCRAYRDGGIVALDDDRVGGNSAKLTQEQVADLSGKLRLYTPRSLFGPTAATADGQAWTVDDLRRSVQEWYGVTYQSIVSYYNLFARCEFSYHRPAKVFKSRNEAAVAEFEAQLEKN
jgi:transposase